MTVVLYKCIFISKTATQSQRPKSLEFSTTRDFICYSVVIFYVNVIITSIGIGLSIAQIECITIGNVQCQSGFYLII